MSQPEPHYREVSFGTHTAAHSVVREEATPATPRVSVIIPTYNEAENILQAIDRCLDALADHPSEIIVVDDDSPDGTWRLVERRYDATDHVRVLRREGARGLATAVAYGFAHATADCCAVIDADLQHPPELLPVLVDTVANDVDIAIASRYVSRGGVAVWPWHRRVVSYGATVLARLCIPSARGVADPLSGYFVVRRDLLREATLSPTGYKILLELLTRCDGAQVREVPYVFVDRRNGDSKLSSREYLEYLLHLAKLSYHSHRRVRA